MTRLTLTQTTALTCWSRTACYGVYGSWLRFWLWCLGYYRCSKRTNHQLQLYVNSGKESWNKLYLRPLKLYFEGIKLCYREQLRRSNHASGLRSKFERLRRTLSEWFENGKCYPNDFYALSNAGIYDLYVYGNNNGRSFHSRFLFSKGYKSFRNMNYFG